MEKFPVTIEGYARLEAELKQLKSTDRPAIISAISEARAHGDLKENAEYHAAKEKQSFIEGRIKELEAVISRADVIDVKSLACDKVKFGATVKLVDEDSEEESTYQIVGEYEADINKNLISITAPIARAMIGKEEGDSIEVRTPKGSKSYEILEIKYI
ncbi:MAG: transcription elongation factor GreA [Rickettsiales bacterium]